MMAADGASLPNQARLMPVIWLDPGCGKARSASTFPRHEGCTGGEVEPHHKGVQRVWVPLALGASLGSKL